VGLLGVLAFVATKGLVRSRLTTALLVLAVAAGVGLQIPNTANLLGYTANLFDEATTHGFGNVRVQHRREAIMEDGDAVAQSLATLPGVSIAVPIVSLPGAATLRGKEMVTEVHGVDPHAPYRPYVIREGKDITAEDDGVLVGTALASKLGVEVGDTLDVRVLLPPPVPAPGMTPDEIPGPTVAQYKMVVRGKARGTFGAAFALTVSRDLLRRATGRPHAATRILLYSGSTTGSAGVSTARREAPRETEALVRAVEGAHPDLRALTWMGDHPVADSAIRANEVLGVVSHTMVVVAVTIPIAALLFVTVESRRREVALMSALGFARSEVFVAFVLQAFVVGIVGAAIGCGFGFLAVRWFEAHPIFDSPEFTVRPVTSAAGFYEPALVVLITTIVAAAYPALRATRVDPARVLRGLA
jgi:ABC-type lipoprotein release transport system permease subunit